MKKFLMCSPEGVFDCLYSINPWMNGNYKNIDKSKALSQWKNLRSIILEHANVETKIEFLDEKTTLPDLVFTANSGLLYKVDDNKRVIISNFAFNERKGEVPFQEKWFRDLGYTPFHVEYIFEGAGDALADTSNRLWVGVEKRSHPKVIDELRALTEGYFKNIHQLHLSDQRFYHLDTCFCPLSKGHIMWYPQAFSTPSYWLIASLIGNRSTGVYVNDRKENDLLVDVSEVDAISFACNAINIDDKIILNKASDPLKGRLKELGYEVIETELTEFIKAGGSAKCLVLELLE